MGFLFKKPLAAALICCGILAGFSSKLYMDLQSNKFATTYVIYNQDQQIDTRIISAIQNADSYVYFAVYTFTRQDIADALIAAKLRGLDVKGVLDSSQTEIDYEKPLIKKLEKYNIELEIPRKDQGLMHLKILVTNKNYVSGSYNWTSTANSINDEIVEIGAVESIRKQYLGIFNELYRKYKKDRA